MKNILMFSIPFFALGFAIASLIFNREEIPTTWRTNVFVHEGKHQPLQLCREFRFIHIQESRRFTLWTNITQNFKQL